MDEKLIRKSTIPETSLILQFNLNNFTCTHRVTHVKIKIIEWQVLNLLQSSEYAIIDYCLVGVFVKY